MSESAPNSEPITIKKIVQAKIVTGIAPGKPLKYFIKREDNVWKEGSVPPCKSFRIGSAPDCEIVITSEDIDLVQVTVQKNDTKWHFIETSSKKRSVFNGAKRRECILDEYSSISLSLDSCTIIFSNFTAEYPFLSDGLENKENQFRLASEKFIYKLSINRFVLMGQHVACGIKVPGQLFSALIYSVNRKIFIASMLPGITVDKQNLIDSLSLSHNSLIDIAGEKFTVYLPPELRISPPSTAQPPQRESVKLCLFEMVNNMFTGLMLKIPEAGKTITIGRSPDNYFVVNGKDVSRKHAQITAGTKELQIADLQSSNGTRLNGKDLQESTLMNIGDIVEFGDKRYRLDTPDLIS